MMKGIKIPETREARALAAIELVRKSFRRDGAEGESVHLIADELEAALLANRRALGIFHAFAALVGPENAEEDPAITGIRTLLHGGEVPPAPRALALSLSHHLLCAIVAEADLMLAGGEEAIRHAERCEACGCGGVGPLRDLLARARAFVRPA